MTIFILDSDFLFIDDLELCVEYEEALSVEDSDGKVDLKPENEQPSVGAY